MSTYTTKKQKDISVSFIEDLNKLLDKIEELSDTIKEGQYLDLMNLMKDLHSYKDEFNQNIIVKTHRERTERPVRANTRPLTREEKLKHDDYTSCSRCDRIVMKRNLAKHQERGICKSILQKKYLAAEESKTFFKKEELINIETRDFKELIDEHEEEVKEDTE
jgi:formylmethanofuran dehydrogenase subunit E